jgi:hypothetical protein
MMTFGAAVAKAKARSSVLPSISSKFHASGEGNVSKESTSLVSATLVLEKVTKSWADSKARKHQLCQSRWFHCQVSMHLPVLN